MLNFLFIFLGGGVGALLRFGISGYVNKSARSNFPWGTLTVNLLGCFIIGALFIVFDKLIESKELKNLITVGLIGSLTTFSTFSLEALNLILKNHFFLAISYLLISIVFGLLFCYLGYISCLSYISR